MKLPVSHFCKVNLVLVNHAHELGEIACLGSRACSWIPDIEIGGTYPFGDPNSMGYCIVGSLLGTPFNMFI